ncbi:hypothetical protein [Leptolinea tardivitalis]|uniref:Capsule biosynthesis protein n=1 Tax=Leptolinea tardivitalis TaxID=229920 RepID=A0A0P6WYL3_9CHLR|nr:hypothetical protein [Leptolinea tardivitalis]KPL71629.1 hypothetical protein ADM99_09095 [Leptolinea tardivitalis]GAP19957.1 capsule polysaccharide biosynthesis protein [Leptolinea tardivitalis]
MTAAAAGKDVVKEILGQIPFTVELYWLIRQRGKAINSHFSLRHLQDALPDMVQDALELRKTAPAGKKIFIFATLHYWIEHAALTGIALAAQGHDVTLGYLAQSDWQKPISRFDLRRQDLYARKVLSAADPVMRSISFVSGRIPFAPVSDEISKLVQQVSEFDTQYSLQIEEIDQKNEVYQLRKERNEEAALTAYSYMKENKPDVVIVPNGTIQELGVVYRIARLLKIPVTTYEFSDQRQRIWLAQNNEVMRQDTDALWRARQNTALKEDQFERLRSMLMARQHGAMWENFARQWQGTPSQGGESARKALGLDNRPVVLLATNVLGDSLTLGRHLFSKTMAEWISRTVQYFAGRPDVQLVIRVHPGEVLTHGTSMMKVVHEVFPKLPEHIRLIGPSEKVNTYDLIEVADVGLVYTTTVGLEMAMNGVPVIVAAQTHYRNRGFTLDPDSWVAYYKTLGQVLQNPAAHRLNRQQVEKAWMYAYRWFFEFPLPYPWHLVRLWDDYKAHPLKSVVGPDHNTEFDATFRYLTGEPINWVSSETGQE